MASKRMLTRALSRSLCALNQTGDLEAGQGDLRDDELQQITDVDMSHRSKSQAVDDDVAMMEVTSRFSTLKADPKKWSLPVRSSIDSASISSDSGFGSGGPSGC